LSKSFRIDLSVNLGGMDCSGVREEITDYCLLQLRAEQHTPLHLAKLKPVLETAAGSPQPGSYADLPQTRLAHDSMRKVTGC
jgi:hypothetical protein